MSSYWLTHKYYRLSVKEFIDEFCGWTALKELMNYAPEGRERAFLSGCFSTGGRVSEVLSLKGENFSIQHDKNLMLVTDMLLVKRYEKLSETVDAEGHKRWITKLTPSKRKRFPILLNEPLAGIFAKYLQGKQGLLFPSPYKPKKPLTRSWAYKLVRWLDDILPNDLREKLGVNKAFVNKDGDKLSPRIHLWLHWFRSQRASQLVYDYDFQLLDLLNFFSWEETKTPLTYANKGWRGLENKMKSIEVHYV